MEMALRNCPTFWSNSKCNKQSDDSRHAYMTIRGFTTFNGLCIAWSGGDKDKISELVEYQLIHAKLFFVLEYADNLV